VQSKPVYSLYAMQWEVDEIFGTNNVTIPDLPSTSLDPYKTFGINYEIGKQRILFNTLTLRYSYGFSVVFPIRLKYVSGGFDDDLYDVYNEFNQDFFNRNTTYRLFYSYLLNFRLGIGMVL
jgi:hypothetical protein